MMNHTIQLIVLYYCKGGGVPRVNINTVQASLVSNKVMANTIFIVRHGDRLDYEVGKDEWARLCRGVGEFPPPGAVVVVVMAYETAQAIGDSLIAANNNASNDNSNTGTPCRSIDHVLTSPFLRCIQTANPIAGRLGLPLCVDEALFEVPCRQEVLPPVSERCRYFPRISREYQSTFRPEGIEEYPHDSLNRCGISGIELAKRFPGKNIVLVTHAANVVAIAACLTGRTISTVPPASPCGIFRLDRIVPSTDTDAPAPSYSNPQYVIAEEFCGSTAHLTHKGTTPAWPTPTVSFGSDFISANIGTKWK
jgi:phosphohistidine phosphatase SixA